MGTLTHRHAPTGNITSHGEYELRGVEWRLDWTTGLDYWTGVEYWIAHAQRTDSPRADV